MKKGFALITVLAIVIILGLGTATILQSVGSQMNMKSNNLQEVKAQYLAEAGMQHALWKCRTSGCTTESITIDGSTVAIDVSALPKIVTTVTYTDV